MGLTLLLVVGAGCILFVAFNAAAPPPNALSEPATSDPDLLALSSPRDATGVRIDLRRQVIEFFDGSGTWTYSTAAIGSCDIGEVDDTGYVRSVTLRTYVNDVKNPIHDVVLLDGGRHHRFGPVYTKARATAELWQARILAVAANHVSPQLTEELQDSRTRFHEGLQRTLTTATQSDPAAQAAILERVDDLKRMLDAGEITDDVYIARCKKIIRAFDTI